jgi:hypothetical protein
MNEDTQYMIAGNVVTRMGLCETEFLILKPNQLYEFVVMPGCARCEELERIGRS